MINSKKAVAMLLVLAMVLAFSVAVAAPSPVVEGDLKDIISETEVSGLSKGLKIVITPNFEDMAEKEAADKVAEDPAAVLEAAELPTDMELSFVADVYAADENDVRVELGKGLDITVKTAVKGIEDGMEVAVLELIDGEWTQIESSVEDGKLVLMFDELNPIAVFAK